MRDTDLLARSGGGEFVVILTETPYQRAIEVAERIRAAVGNTSFSAGGDCECSTISIGVSSFTQDVEQQDGVMVRADRKLYESKRKGKNAV